MKRPIFFLLAALSFSCSCDSCNQQPQPAEQSQQSQESQGSASAAQASRPKNILQAQQTGGATIRVTGIDVQQIHLEISSPYPGTIVIPAGTVFASGSSGTQTMISAQTVQVVFPGVSTYTTPQVQSLDVEVYCINRMLDAPTGDSLFTVVSGGRELDPVRRLAACLESKDADHYSRQLAIWMTSDHFIDMTEQDVRQTLKAHFMEQLTSDKGIDELAKATGVPAAQLQQIRNNPEFLDTVSQAASKEVDDEISLYKTKARDLLSQCNFDLSTSKFFQS